MEVTDVVKCEVLEAREKVEHGAENEECQGWGRGGGGVGGGGGWCSRDKRNFYI